MMAFSLWKNLKKRLRRKRRPVWMLGCMLLTVLAASLVLGQTTMATELSAEPTSNSVLLHKLDQYDEPIAVKLHLVYVCGEESKPLGRLMGKQIKQLLLTHPEWKAELDEQHNSIVLEQQVEDLSEYCKENAYIGLDKEGNLTLFDGVPKKEKVVRTFFQLDVNYLESSLPKDKLDELAHGIRIIDMNEFNSVISTFSDYALERNEKVMNPAY
ncbi:hypothetical protein D3C78_1076700 [compost metagenome]